MTTRKSKVKCPRAWVEILNGELQMFDVRGREEDIMRFKNSTGIRLVPESEFRRLRKIERHYRELFEGITIATEPVPICVGIKSRK